MLKQPYITLTEKLQNLIMHKKLLISIFIGLVIWILSANLWAQPDTLWTKTYGGTGSDRGESVCQTTDGDYIIAGSTRSFGAGGSDVWLIKTDANGDTLWTRTFGGTDTDRGFSVCKSTNDGYAIAGYTSSYGAGGNDVYLIKTDANGDTLWTKTFGGTGSDRSLSVCKTTDDGYIIAGYTNSYGAGGNDVYLVRTDANGDTLWTKTYGGTDNDWGRSVCQTTDGGYVITGETLSYGIGLYDVYLIKTDCNGDTLWTKTYGGTGNDYGFSVCQTIDEDYLIVGYTSSFGKSLGDVYLIKTDSNGNTYWQETYGGYYTDCGYSICEIVGGGYVIAGETWSFGAGQGDVYLIKTDIAGCIIWTKTIGGITSDHGYSIRQTTDEGFIIAGYTDSFGAGGNDVYLIKTDMDPVGIDNHEDTLSNLQYIQNYPNPFKNHTAISYTLKKPRNIIMRIYNVKGKLVQEIFKGNKYTGTHTIEWDAKDMTPGIYFYKLTADKKEIVKKMVLMR